MAVSTSAAEPLTFDARTASRSATTTTASSKRARAACSSSASWSKASMALCAMAVVATTTGAYATPGTTGVPLSRVGWAEDPWGAEVSIDMPAL